MENAYRMEVKVKNNLIYRRIMRDYKNVAEFCRVNQLRQTDVGKLLAFQEPPKRKDGEWREIVYDISSALHCEPEELFTQQQMQMLAKKAVATTEISEQALNALATPSHGEKAEENDLINKLSENLTPREKKVLRLRYFEDMTLRETGQNIDNLAFHGEGITNQRVRDIEGKAIRKMRRKAIDIRVLNPYR